jgi:hypothetical protein
VIDSVSFSDSYGGLLQGISKPLVIESAIFRNTDSAIRVSGTPVYFEETEFITNDGVERNGLEVQCQISMVGCSFKGFSVAISVMNSGRPFFVCRSKFTNCGKRMDLAIETANIVSCLFENYTIVGLVSSIEYTDEVVVEKCAFIGGSVLAMKINGFPTVRGTCFNGNGIVIEVEDSGNLKIGDDCCFRATKENAISGTVEISGESRFSCMLECTPGNVSFEASVCFGSSFKSRQTPLPTQVPIPPVRIRPTQSQSSELTPKRSIEMTATGTNEFTPPAFERRVVRHILRIGCLGFMIVF